MVAQETNRGLEALTVPDPVRILGLEAVWETEALCGAIRELCDGLPFEGDPTARKQVQMKVRGMTMRIEQLCRVGMSILEDEADVATLTPRVLGAAAGRGVAESEADAARQLQGGIAFYEMLRKMDAVPEVLRAGFTAEEDDSTIGGLHVAQDLAIEAATRCGFDVTDPAPAAGFMGCLARHLLADLQGYSLGYGESSESDARAALREVAAAAQGTSLEER